MVCRDCGDIKDMHQKHVLNPGGFNWHPFNPLKKGERVRVVSETQEVRYYLEDMKGNTVFPPCGSRSKYGSYLFDSSRGAKGYAEKNGLKVKKD